MEILLLWSIFGVVGYFIGKAKGRADQGVVLGLLLGPVGWLLVRFGRDYRTEKEKTKATEQTTRIRVAKDGQDLGFMDLPSIKLHLRSGSLTSANYYYDEDKSDWVPLGSCTLLAAYWQNLSQEQSVS